MDKNGFCAGILINDLINRIFQSLPGGFNALQRMYRDIQEPMMNAATEGLGNNPFSALAGNNASGQGNQGVENTQPLPNPWGGGTTAPTTGTSTSSTSTTSTAGGGGTGKFDRRFVFFYEILDNTHVPT